MDPYPESPNVADEAGDGVYMEGLKPDDWENVGLCSNG